MQQKHHKKNKTESIIDAESKKKINGYAKYSGMAIQMGLIITIGSFGGVKLDQYLEFEFPVFTLSLSILSVVMAVYLAIKDIIKYNS